MQASPALLGTVENVALLAPPPPAGLSCVKVLNPVTNRYHMGLITGRHRSTLRVELPPSAKLQAGQRVRFVVANQQALVARTTMQSAWIRRVSQAAMSLQVEFRVEREPA